jgi:hypothetical protein
MLQAIVVCYVAFNAAEGPVQTSQPAIQTRTINVYERQAFNRISELIETGFVSRSGVAKNGTQKWSVRDAIDLWQQDQQPNHNWKESPDAPK